MALFDLFKKKKKEDYLDLRNSELAPFRPSDSLTPRAPSTEAPLPEFVESPTQYPSPAQALQPPGADFTSIKQQLDAINYKLDALKAALDAINTRLTNIETALKTMPGSREGWTY